MQDICINMKLRGDGPNGKPYATAFASFTAQVPRAVRTADAATVPGTVKANHALLFHVSFSFNLLSRFTFPSISLHCSYTVLSLFFHLSLFFSFPTLFLHVPLLFFHFSYIVLSPSASLPFHFISFTFLSLSPFTCPSLFCHFSFTCSSQFFLYSFTVSFTKQHFGFNDLVCRRTL